jgi:hypothetical protein
MSKNNPHEDKPKDQAGFDKEASRYIAPVNRLPEVGTGAGKVPKVRHAGHFVDQKLKYNNPSRGSDQLNLFDRLSPELLGQVKKTEIKCEGIRLSVPDDRLLNAIMGLVREKSENKATDSKQFYRGNYQDPRNEVIPWGAEEIKPAMIRIVPAELYKAYLGNNEYSGKDITEINKTLESLAEKRFLITYDRVRQVKVGKKIENRTDRIEKVGRLIDVVKYTKDLTDTEKARLDKGDRTIRQEKGELIIALNPVLTDQINSKYIDYPSDIGRRTMIAAGGHPNMVTQAINTLRDWLLRELSSKRTKWEVNADTLPYLLKLENYVREGRRKKIKETIEKSIQTCKNLNLILDVSETQGAEGQIKYVFTLNPDFE